MKVLYIVGGSGKRYGSEIIAYNNIRILREKYGIQFLVILAAEGFLSEYCKQNGIDYIVKSFRDYVYKKPNNAILATMKKQVRLFQAKFSDEMALMKIRKLNNLSTFDIVHTNISRNLLGAKISSRFGIPHVWQLQEITRGHYDLDFLMIDQAQYMVNNTDLFIAVSKLVKDAWSAEGIPASKIHIVKNGIDLSRIVERKDYVVSNDIKIVMVGYVSSHKGQDQLINAISLFSEEERKHLSVDFIGGWDERYKKYLNNLVLENKLDGIVRFMGYCENLGEILSGYNIGVACAKLEAFGLSTVEYMAAGLCVIASDTGNNTEIINHGNNGYLYKYGDYDDLYLRIKAMLDNPEQLESVSRRARSTVEERYRLETMVDGIYSLYCRVVDERKASVQ